MATVALSTKAIGSIVKIKESGVLQEFYVARHNAYTTGRTLLVRRYTHSDRKWHTSNVNAYATSALDAWFNGEYLNSLPAEVRAVITTVSIPYTPGNGNWTLSTLSRRVFALSGTELGQAQLYMLVEGTSLGSTVVNLLKIATDSAGKSQPQWTRSPYTGDIGDAWLLNVNGVPKDYSCGLAHAVRPAFTLPSSILVSDTGAIITNTPPVINYNGLTQLGKMSEGFSVSYSVSDQMDDTVTVVEKLDNKVLRTYAATLDAENELSIMGDAWTEVLNGSHTLTITATDAYSASDTRTITFSKDTTGIEFITKDPAEMESMPTVLSLKVFGAFPVAATAIYHACNNGFDDSPVWEDVTTVIQNGYAYTFGNAEKTAEHWGVRIKIKIERNDGSGDCYVDGLTYAYRTEGSDAVQAQIAALTVQNKQTDELLDTLLTQVLPQLMLGEGETV